MKINAKFKKELKCNTTTSNAKQRRHDFVPFSAATNIKVHFAPKGPIKRYDRKGSKDLCLKIDCKSLPLIAFSMSFICSLHTFA